jgi:hypothetical protein
MSTLARCSSDTRPLQMGATTCMSGWLLMCHDRLDGDELALAHEFLSLMLGVRRSGVTEQLHVLEGLHAIKATRGNIRIIDREKLEDVAGGCYGAPEAEYKRLIESQVDHDFGRPAQSEAETASENESTSKT